MSASSAVAKRSDIQGLRALAVALVILGHVGVPGVRSGFIGVDVFFVVSGLLITSLLLKEAGATGRVTVVAFYARRARRILPAATVVLVATTLYAAYRLPGARAERIADDALWSAFFGANIHFAKEGTDYFAVGQEPSPLQHYWSLAVEEQFYLVWPTVIACLVLALRRRSTAAMVGVVGAACVVSFWWSTELAQASSVSAYFATTARIWELGAGALLALLASAVARLPRWLCGVLGASGLATILVAATLATTGAYDAGQALLATLGTAAVLASGQRAGPVGLVRILALRPAQWVGDTSYSLYLWHWPVLVFGAGYAGNDASPTRRLGLVVLILLLATASYYLVERPFRSRSRIWSHPRRVLLLWPAALGATLASTAWTSDVTAARMVEQEREAAAYYEEVDRLEGSAPKSKGRSGVSGRIERSLRLAEADAPIPFPLTNLEDLETDNWERHYPCHAAYTETSLPLCTVGDQGAKVTVAALGDSHMGMWLSSLDFLGKRDGFRVVTYVKYSCSPYDVPIEIIEAGHNYSECDSFRSWARSQVQRMQPVLVLLSSRGLAGGRSTDTLESRVPVWREGVAGTVEWYRSRGMVVKVLADVPVLTQEPGDCLTARNADMASCVFGFGDRLRLANSVVRAAAERAGADFVDVTLLVCSSGRCPIVVDRTVTYRDDDHISVTWGKTIAGEFGSLVGMREALAVPQGHGSP